MKGRKTFDVTKFKTYVNTQLARTDAYATEEFKGGLCIALEEVLQRTDNYKGYNYLYWNEIGWQLWRTEGKETENWDEKKKYIYGEKGSKYNACKNSRVYY